MALEAGSLAVGCWCGSAECEQRVKAETGATIRFLPLDRLDPGAACVACGRPGADTATWAQAC
ncbi:MAG: hypothetical protein ACXVYV_01880 [Gaiellales bacterium]